EAKAELATNPLVPQLLKTLQSHGEIPYQIALRTTDITSHVEHFKEQKIPFVGPLDGSRRTPNGVLMQWNMLFPEADNQVFHPFIITWGEKINLPDDKTKINNKTISAIS